jgi:hypothetical protein
MKIHPDVATSARAKDEVTVWIEARAAPLKEEGLFNG